MEEYQKLEAHYKCTGGIDYVQFNEAIESIFTEKDLEKEPSKTLSAYHAPSILDAKTALSADEEAELNVSMKRLGTDVRNRRLLLNPFFRDADKANSGFVKATRFRSDQRVGTPRLLSSDASPESDDRAVLLSSMSR